MRPASAARGHAELVERVQLRAAVQRDRPHPRHPRGRLPRIKQLAWDFARAGEKTVTPEVVGPRRRSRPRLRASTSASSPRRRRSNPGDDLLSSLLAGRGRRRHASRHTELVANCILLLQAGHETTQDLLGNAQVALFRHPDQLALLRDHPELTKNAVEEFLRYDGSVQINHRVVLDGMTVGDVDIRRARDGLHLPRRGNRDPARYPEPDRLDITRDVTHHLAFSFGAYYCIGAALARTEIAVGIRTLLDRFPGLRPATGKFEWRNTLQLRGPQRLDVTW